MIFGSISFGEASYANNKKTNNLFVFVYSETIFKIDNIAKITSKKYSEILNFNDLLIKKTILSLISNISVVYQKHFNINSILKESFMSQDFIFFYLAKSLKEIVNAIDIKFFLIHKNINNTFTIFDSFLNSIFAKIKSKMILTTKNNKISLK